MKKLIVLFSFVHFCFLSFSFENLDTVLITDFIPEFNTTKAINKSCNDLDCTKLKIIDFVNKNKRYPSVAKKNNITGRVIVQFFHDKTGNIKNIEIIKSVNKYLDDEAIRLIKSIPKLNQLSKSQYPTYYKIPVIFELNTRDKILNATKKNLENWLVKGEFEKTSDYILRTSIVNQEKKFNELYEVEKSFFKKTFLKNLEKKKSEFQISEYNADNEFFIIYYPNLEVNDSLILNVPIQYAVEFKDNFKSILKSNLVNLDADLLNDFFVLTQARFIFKNGSRRTKGIYFDFDISDKENYYTTNYKPSNFFDSNEFTVRNDYFDLTSKEYLTRNLNNNRPNKNRYALIIGNENYSRFQNNLQSEQDVPFAINDANTFKTFAIKIFGVKKENLIYLTNATAAQINQEIDRIIKLVNLSGDNAEFIFYYAGHGFPDEKNKTPYLIPVDVSTSYLYNAISLDDLYLKFSNTKAKKVMIFIDACFSGGARESSLLVSRGVKVNPKITNVSKNLVVFTATSNTQSALPFKQQSHGMFTFYLLKKLKETKGDITLGELFDYVKYNVQESSLKINSREQTPNVIYSPAIENKWKNWQVY